MRAVNFGGCFIACERAKEQHGAEARPTPWVGAFANAKMSLSAQITTSSVFIGQFEVRAMSACGLRSSHPLITYP